MNESTLIINIVIDNKTENVPYTSTTTAEDVCILVCKQLGITPVARHLFALRDLKLNFLMPASLFNKKNTCFDLRIRYKVANIGKLKDIDQKAYDYYFHQARTDVLENKIPDLVYEKYKNELVGLGVTDMYRVMLEKDIPRESVESDYKKYIPKAALKRGHPLFIKKPIHDSLGKLKKSGHNSFNFVKMEYLKQLEMLAPEYLAEEFKAISDFEGSSCIVHVKVSPHHPKEPGIKICRESSRENWQQLCTIDELCYISVREDGTVEISRKNGIPFYLKFPTLSVMFSFVSLLDGYYRLMCKWIFNICKDVLTPSLQRLYAMRCHGPIGGEFSYEKLEEKRGNRPGCFILRESELRYNIYYIDVCLKETSKPKTFKLELLPGSEFIFNNDLTRYKNINQLISTYNDPNGEIFLQECLPPSEYDMSPLLLCQSNFVTGDSLADSSSIHGIITTAPVCISSKNIQVYKANYSTFGNLTDPSLCKVSHLGVEYRGHIAKSESGVRCQKWETDTPVHKVNEDYVDSKFPEFSRKLANNFCRNPSRDPKGPWCYTMDPNLIDDTCGLPICVYTECRITGPGIEYSGPHNSATSGKKCLKWNKVRNKVRQKDEIVKQNKYDKRKFPDESLADAKKYCRNPNGDVGGPWCFVEVEDSDIVEIEYCDIPFCDDEDCTFFSKNCTTYYHYLDFNHSLTNLTFGLKLWDSDSYYSASARLVLSTVSLPFTGKQIEDAGVGIEIFLSNEHSALTFGNKDKPEYEPSVGILKSTEFTFFSLSWARGFMSLNKEGEPKPIFLAEYKTKKNLLGFLRDKFNFYSTQGTNVLWSFPFCDDEGDCDVHTTTSSVFNQFWILRETNVGHDLQFFVRAFHSAYILLVTSPAIDFPCMEIMLDRFDNLTRVQSIEYPGAPKTILKEIALSSFLNYWKWSELSISLFADNLQVYVTKDVGTHMVLELKHDLVRKLRWFSPGSENSIAHWTFYCKPPQFANSPEAWPPECSLNKNEPEYKGTQSVTSTGLPCVPWSSVKLLPDSAKSLFSEDVILKSINYCRDPKQELQGTFCYAITQKPDVKIEQNYCHIRPCKSSECRMAGTGNDYIGKLNTTRSNRTCKNWVQHIVNNNISTVLLNETLYADMSAENAENYCRNPTRNIAGSWCYTTDSGIQDVCDVRDCNKPEECTVLIRGNGEGRDVYILPQWKEAGIHGGLRFSLKDWNPDLLDGVAFEIKSLNHDYKIKLVIGANNNEKIILYYQSQVEKENTFPHLIPAGKWVSFWLQIRKGEVMLGYEGIPHSLFEWKHEDPSTDFEPIFLTYTSIAGHPIGFFFKCDDCHSEVTATTEFSKIMPIGLWSQSESLHYNNFSLNVRGIGSAVLGLFSMPDIEEHYSLVFNTAQNTVSFVRNRNGTNASATDTLISENLKNILIANNTWTTLTISFNETNLNVTKNNTLILHYSSAFPMLFYWFSMGVTSGSITWTANCEPPDIDGKPLNGGWSHWSPWQCTVSCGGGDGFRTRTCSNPRPNIFGKLCEGPSSSSGVCNDFPCGDVSPETLEKIREHLQKDQLSLIKNEGESVVIENDHKILRIISDQSPDAYYEWTRNGKFVTSDTNRVEFKNDNVIISNVSVADMGVYVCMLHRINKHRVVFRVVTLAVLTKHYRISTRATLDVIVVSNAVVLGYIFSDLRQKWMINDTTYMDYGITTLAAVSSEHVKSLNMSHSGVWKCVIEQSDLHLSWVTNLIKIQVKSAPNFYTHLMEDNLTAPLFSWLKTERNIRIALVFIVVFVCLTISFLVFAYFKWGTLRVAVPAVTRKRKYKRNRRK